MAVHFIQVTLTDATSAVDANRVICVCCSYFVTLCAALQVNVEDMGYKYTDTKHETGGKVMQQFV
jgi:hypothetical protein